MVFCLLGIVWPKSLGAAQSTGNPALKAPPTKSLPDADEQAALNQAFRSAQSNPQLIIKNLQAFLDRYPHSSRREAVLRTICSYALAANAPGVIVQYGQMLLAMTPDDPKLLNLLIDALARQNDQPSRNLAIDYTARLIRIAEAERDRAALAGGNDNAAEQWTQRIASTYAKLAGLHRDSGDIDKAASDLEKSYATYATARAAEQLGDLAMIKGDSARAMDFYLTAFAFPDKGSDPIQRQEIRRKLGSLYIAQHHSEQGLGDLVLSRYDSLMPQLASRFSGGQPQNAGIQDPFKFVLERMDGTRLSLADYHGKVLLLDFWATWCGPCRMQGKLVDQVAQNFHADPNIVFLSLNMDQDRSGVPAFLKQAGWNVPAAYAQGLDQLLGVTELPTLVVFDRQGRIVFREEGLDPDTFVEVLSKHLRETLEAGGSKQ
jgi:thiol-disulfide isomerase/thioredoxin/predicted negative regulator of RcsB-dependent stress response